MPEQGLLYKEWILGYGGTAGPNQRNGSEPNSVGAILAPKGVSDIEFLAQSKESIIPFYKAVDLAFRFAGRGELEEVATQLVTIAKVGKQHGLRGVDKLVEHLEFYALGSYYKAEKYAYRWLVMKIDEIIANAPLDKDIFKKLTSFRRHLEERRQKGKVMVDEVIRYFSGQKPITKLRRGNYLEGEVYQGLFIDKNGHVFISQH